MDTRTYEGMFLLDSTQAAQEWDNLRKQVIGMLERRGGSIVSAKKWAERKLAYEIKGHKRGTYFLVYFDMAPPNIAILRRDLHLSELIIRHLILVHPRHFKVPEIVENVEPDAAAEASKKEAEAAPAETAQASQAPKRKDEESQKSQ